MPASKKSSLGSLSAGAATESSLLARGAGVSGVAEAGPARLVSSLSDAASGAGAGGSGSGALKVAVSTGAGGSLACCSTAIPALSPVAVLPAAWGVGSASLSERTDSKSVSDWEGKAVSSAVSSAAVFSSSLVENKFVIRLEMPASKKSSLGSLSAGAATESSLLARGAGVSGVAEAGPARLLSSPSGAAVGAGGFGWSTRVSVSGIGWLPAGAVSPASFLPRKKPLTVLVKRLNAEGFTASLAPGTALSGGLASGAVASGISGRRRILPMMGRSSAGKAVDGSKGSGLPSIRLCVVAATDGI